jgi:hypothetical protein
MYYFLALLAVNSFIKIKKQTAGAKNAFATGGLLNNGFGKSGRNRLGADIRPALFLRVIRIVVGAVRLRLRLRMRNHVAIRIGDRLLLRLLMLGSVIALTPAKESAVSRKNCCQQGHFQSFHNASKSV